MRSGLDLIIDVLKCISKHPKIKRTRIIQYTGINYTRGGNLLDYLIYREFIKVDEKNRHTLTQKAFNWLKQMESLINEVTDNGEVRTRTS